MQEEKFIKLTNATYKLLSFFPEEDPLKNKAKEKTLVIMEHLTLLGGIDGWASFQKEKVKEQVFNNIDILLHYFLVAKSQGWLSSINFFIISNEYEKIKKEVKPYIELTKRIPFKNPSLPEVQEELKPLFIAEKKEAPAPPDLPPPTLEKKVANVALSERQKKILEFITKHKTAQVMDLQNVLSGVTKRTIRRDLDELLEKGKLKRVGEFNKVSYEIGQDAGEIG